MRTLLRIEIAGPDRRARRLVFEGEEAVRLTSAAVVKALGLTEGAAVESAELDAELEAAEADCARDRALRVLGHRDRSSHEIERRLANDGYPEAVVERVVSRLKELSLIDDERFAELWARSRALAGVGPNRIRNELVAKGIDKESAIAAANAGHGESDPVDDARRVLGSRPIVTRQERERALRKLLRRGFDMSVALQALDLDKE